MTSLIEVLRSWVEKEAEHYTYHHFPNPKAEIKTLVPYGSYFRITLAEMFLTTQRAWFTQFHPAANTVVRIQHADYEPVELSHVTHVPGQTLAKGVDLNRAVTGLIPYNGGTLELDCALLAIKGKDYLDASLKMLGSFSDLVAGPVSQALAIAGKVAASVQELFVSGNGEVQLNFGQTFSEGKPPQTGYHCVILATADDLKGRNLSVVDDQLMADGKNLTGYDYLLVRLDGVKARDDWRMKEIQKNLTLAKKAYLKKKDDEGDEYRAAALVAVHDSTDLTEVDKERAENAIRDELEPYRKGGHGAVGAEVERALNDIMKSAQPWEAAAKTISQRRPILRTSLKQAV